MYYVCITVRTDDTHVEHARIDQAFVGCWMDRENEEEAVEDAKTMIIEEPWVIEEVESVSQVTADDYVDDPENLGYYEQALEDKNVLVFNVCPRFTTYFVQFDIVQDKLDETTGQPTSEGFHADATVWVSNETVVSEEPSPEEIDMMAEDFWSEQRVARALEIAIAVVENEGWKVTETVKHWPFSYRHLDRQPDLADYVDGAEEDGVSLVIWDKDGELEADEKDE
jgi:hypothetical protein